jgi:hypothetical protein
LYKYWYPFEQVAFGILVALSVLACLGAGVNVTALI